MGSISRGPVERREGAISSPGDIAGPKHVIPGLYIDPVDAYASTYFADFQLVKPCQNI